MPKINQDPVSPVAETMERYLQAMPVMVTGINRKVNIGNYETIDLYFALLLPLPQAVGVTDPNELRSVVEEASQVGYSIAAKEVNERYNLLKEMSKK